MALDEISHDPYATSANFGSPSAAPASSFGSAFDDDAAQPSQDVFLDSGVDSLPPLSSYDPFAVDAASSGAQTPRLNLDGIGAIRPGTVAPAFGIYGGRGGTAPGGVDYVFSEDYKEVRKKTSTEQLTYLGGMAYLTGAFVGGGMGVAEGVRASAGKASKLRINAVLNAAGKRGALAANSLGVLALLFSVTESAAHNYVEDDTMWNYMVAGAASGALFKSTKGPRAVVIWAAGGAAVAVGAVYASRQGSYGKGLQGVL